EQGFREAMRDANVPVHPELVLMGAYVPEIAQEAAHRLLTGPHRPTAVFAANDQSAIATIDVARSLGLRVPYDLSVVGFDNVPGPALGLPPLTTVEHPIARMGKEAVEMLVRLIRGEELTDIHTTLETRIIVRQSTRRLR